MSKKRVWQDFDRVPSEAVPAKLKEDGQYRPDGYVCWQCRFTTTKRGFAGRQALRAHLKLHANQRRAWQRPLRRQALITLAAVCAVVAGEMGLLRAPASLPVTVDQALLNVAVALWCGLVLLVSYIGIPPSVDPSPGRLRVMYMGWALGTLGVVAYLAALLGFVSVGVPWLWHVAAATWGSCALWLAPAMGTMTWALARRLRRPAAYSPLMLAKDDEAKYKLDGWLRRQAMGRAKSKATRRLRP